MVDPTPVRELYRALVNRDFAALGGVLADDVLMSVTGRSRYAGDYQGRDAVVPVLQGLSRLRPKLTDAWDVCVSDHHAVLMDWFEGEEADRTFLGYVAFVCAVENGRIVRIFPYFENQYAFDEFFAAEPVRR